MDSSSSPQKKGLSGLAWLGIGCGGVIVLIVIGIIIVSVLFGPKIKQIAEEAAKNPTRAAATTMITVGGGKLEMAAEDEAHKRYTIRDKQSGKLTTFYWDAKKQAPTVIPGDFSAIPADANTPSAPSTPSEPAPK